MSITKNHVVTMHYVLTDAENQLIDKSTEEQPFAYLHGHSQIIPGLESALENKVAGDSFSVTISPAEAYGEYNPALQKEVPLSHFEGAEVEPGMRFLAQTEAGDIPVVVRSVNEDTVVIDSNHELAGKTLHFKVEVVDVRPASEKELAHGHIHHADSSCEH